MLSRGVVGTVELIIPESIVFTSVSSENICVVSSFGCNWEVLFKIRIPLIYSTQEFLTKSQICEIRKEKVAVLGMLYVS
jgi:hypothetical protein